jgi:hypothetical protein
VKPGVITTIKEVAMTKYKFRAECIDDVLVFRKDTTGKITSLVVNFDDKLPDVTVTFESDEDPKYIESVIAQIQDGHVMRESLNYADNYTGERTSFGMSWL